MLLILLKCKQSYLCFRKKCWPIPRSKWTTWTGNFLLFYRLIQVVSLCSETGTVWKYYLDSDWWVAWRYMWKNTFCSSIPEVDGVKRPSGTTNQCYHSWMTCYEKDFDIKCRLFSWNGPSLGPLFIYCGKTSLSSTDCLKLMLPNMSKYWPS